MRFQDPVDASEAWQATLGELQLQMTKATFDTWLKATYVVAYEDGTFIIATHNAYAKDWLEHKLAPVIKRTLGRIMGRSVELKFVVRTKGSKGKAPELLHAHTNGSKNGHARDEMSPAQQAEQTERRLVGTLNPRYTFDTFIVGSGNRLAYAAALAVAERPADRYNPLFIFGGVGLGKTHLLHAIGHAAVRRNNRVVYISTEQFTNELITAIRTRKTEEFRNKYRDVDVLLIDDIQFIAGKQSTQEEFFHTFNTLHAANRQIVIAADRPPQALNTLEPRLRSRFEWGLIADIQPPDLETRMAILGAKAENLGVTVPMPVIEFLAHKFHSNIRELEGALTRVVAFSEVAQAPLSVELAREALQHLAVQHPTPTLDEILQVVADFYHLTTAELTGPSRAQRVSIPRQMAMYLMREEAKASLLQIGQALGGRDHSTILHGCEKIARALDSDEQIRREMQMLREQLYHQVA